MLPVNFTHVENMSEKKEHQKPSLSVVLPCYNEMEILHQSIFLLTDFLDNTNLSYELILIDDFSHDGTREEIPKIAKTYPQIRYFLHKKNLGRGGTVSEGIRLAEAEIVGYLDIDLEIPQWYILPAFLMLQKGADMVMANRIDFKLHLKIFIRWITNRGYNILTRKILGVSFTDTEAGFKFFKKEKILPVLDDIEDNGWFWDTEIVIRSFYKGLKIGELPSLFIKNLEKTSTVHVFKDSMDYFIKLIKFRKKARILKRNSQDLRRKQA